VTDATFDTAIALVGVAGRFPGAPDVRRLWNNLRAGEESIAHFTEQELLDSGVPAELLADPAYVRAGSVIDDIEKFDAGFFGYPPREAQLLDPQQRLFLENAWHALEDAGLDPARFDGAIGVIAGSALSTYLLNNLAAHPEMLEMAGSVQVGLGNDKDSLATRVAHALDLTGPAYTVQSYCSTSLVAVALGCSTLVSGEADVVLAGGVTVNVPHRVGYLYQEAGMTSPDGRCRAFDADAQGTPVGSGVGVVALRRLEDALADGDRVYAVLRGWAVNNDGSAKVGFTAPGVRGQSWVIAEALAAAGFEPPDIDYVEVHGTGTPLGDAAEIAAIQRVFDVDGVEHCLLGSAKTNLGHLDRAAGVTGLIKTALSLYHEEIPPTLNFQRPNPQLARSNGRLNVVTSLRPWPRGERVRRAGVSAFGIGGTNAHVVLEEHAPAERTPRPRSHQVLPWSARTAAAADVTTGRLAETAVGLTDQAGLADVAYTLQTGRAVFEHRRALVANSAQDALEALSEEPAHRVLSRQDATTSRSVGFLLAGVGEHYRGMISGLYRTEPVFAAAVDECSVIFREHLGLDPVEELLSDRGQGADELARLLGREDPAEDSALARTEIVQPAMFAADYALATLLMSWGVRPRVLLGYSVGEFVAACLAGSLTVAEAAGLVSVRARLISDLPAGGMAAIPLSAAELTERFAPRADFGVDIAAQNGPRFSVVSGPADALRALAERLGEERVPCRNLRTTHAFHSTMLRPVAAELTAWAAANLRPQAPSIPYLSNVTGRPVTLAQLADPGYWAEHMCRPVRFADMLTELFAGGEDVLLEIGPGQSLGAMARNHPDCTPERWPLLVPTLPAEADPSTDEEVLAGAVAQLWLTGVPVDWAAYHRGRSPRKTDVPDYPFERERYWVEAAPVSAVPAPARSVPARATPSHQEELLAPRWTPAPLPDDAQTALPDGPVWVFADDGGIAEAVSDRLAAADRECLLVRPGPGYQAGPEWTIRPDDPADYQRLLNDAGVPGAVLHLWGADSRTTDADGAVLLGFDSLCALATVMGAATASRLPAIVVTGQARAVAPDDRPVAERAIIFGACLVIPQEYPSLEIRAVDVDDAGPDAIARVLLPEMAGTGAGYAVAWRDGARSVLDFAPVSPSGEPLRAEPGGVYLLTGGLGEVGLLMAGHLGGASGATVILTGRTAVPPASEWDAVLADGTDPALCQRLSRLRELAANAVTVETVVADTTDETRMREIVTGAIERHGRLDGILHLPALSGLAGFGPLSDLEVTARNAHFTPKLYGTRALERAVAGLPVGFCALFSSMSTVLGGIGFSGYAAANSFVDAVPGRHAGESTRWLTINWDTWAPTAAALSGKDVGATQVEYALSERQALAAFDRALAQPGPRTVVSAGDLAERIGQWVSGRDAVVTARPTGDRFPRPQLSQQFVPPTGPRERRLAGVWEDVLGIDGIGARDNFSDLGGTSLMALQVVKQVQKAFGVAVSAVSLFEAPNVHTMAALLDRLDGKLTEHPQSAKRVTASAPAGPTREQWSGDGLEPIAIIGMACRFPGANGPEAFWRNLDAGVESVSWFDEETLRASGVAAEVYQSPDYVPARPVLDDVRGFDAGFFGYSPRDATITDPQHRLMLEIAWEALDDGGYGSESSRDRVGVFVGSNISAYMSRQAGLSGGEGDLYAAVIGNDKDSLATGVSYKLGLTGPSLSVQTFCSTALVAAHLACQSLRGRECELALAGGVSIHVPDRVGHLYQPGGMESPDGHVRTFDAGAKGTLFGDGAGVVLLKRLSDAVADGDNVYAVIRGSAVNNDGALKVGYTAPSVVGQARVISDAMAAAQVTPEQIGYVEAHGTATELGDPIEVAALTRAFGETARRQYCPIGSVKTNIGHLAAAAGASGLIKTVLSLRNRKIPASLHFSEPNPEIDFAASPFYVNTELADWPAPARGRRIAGINSLGMGGTNVHLVVEEAPAAVPSPAKPQRRFELFPLSGRSAAAADQSVHRLRDHLGTQPSLRSADVAYTLQAGRGVFDHRRVMVAGSLSDVADGSARVLARHEAAVGRSVGFLLAGVGEHYPGMVGELYRNEPEFRSAVDECGDVLRYLLDADVTGLLTAPRQRDGNADPLRAMIKNDQAPDPLAEQLARTEIAQPAMFVAEYALARLLSTWGIQPSLMLGYSVGEYVAACLAGVLSLQDALRLVVFRAGLIAKLPAGSMLAVSLTPGQIAARFGPLTAAGIDIAAVNGPDMTVVAGPVAAVEAFAARLEQVGEASRRITTTHAFHTRMLAPAADELTPWVKANLRPSAPRLPYVSNLTGQLATEELVTDPEYWARHMVSTVRFADGLATMLADPDLVLLEIGPGRSLGSMARVQPGCNRERAKLVAASLPSAVDPRPDDLALSEGMAALWLSGVELDWAGYHRDRGVKRAPLPSYPFERQEYWLEALPASSPAATADGDDADGPLSLPLLPEEEWMHSLIWRQTAPRAGQLPAARWLLLAGPADDEVGRSLARRLADAGGNVVLARANPEAEELIRGEDGYLLRPGDGDQVRALLRELRETGGLPERVVHLWTLRPDWLPGPAGDGGDELAARKQAVADAMDFGAATLIALAKGAADVGSTKWALDVVTSGTSSVTGAERLCPELATLHGPIRVIPLEYPEVDARLIDLDPDERSDPEATARLIAAELADGTLDPVVALRRGRRWLPDYERLPADLAARGPGPLRENGVYLVTGGLGGIGLAMAERLARDYHARLVLFGRTGVPAREQWDAVLADPATTDEVRRRLTGLRQIEELGSEVAVVTGDVSDPDSTRAAVRTALDRFGVLHGVLHAAGLPGIGLMQFKTRAEIDKVLAPKVVGTIALEAALHDVPVDFLALFSSITSATGGGPGQVDYCAANGFLDAYACAAAADGRLRVVSIGWGEWQWNAWSAGLAGYATQVQEFFKENRRKFGIDFDSGWRALARVLGSGQPHVVVNPQDFAALVRASRMFNVDAVNQARGKSSTQRHPRMNLMNPFVPPSGEVECAIAEVWAEMLGVTEVGATDSFFNLGGNSLIGIEVMARIRRQLDVHDLAPHVLYEAPTVSALARLLGAASDRPDPAAEHAVRGDQRRAALRRQAAQKRKGQ
jgi:acyl transferase domain-containing protein/acyl carrier protein